MLYLCLREMRDAVVDIGGDVMTPVVTLTATETC